MQIVDVKEGGGVSVHILNVQINILNDKNMSVS